MPDGNRRVLGQVAAIHGQQNARNPGRRIRSQENSRANDIFRFAQPPNRQAAQEICFNAGLASMRSIRAFPG